MRLVPANCPKFAKRRKPVLSGGKRPLKPPRSRWNNQSAVKGCEACRGVRIKPGNQVSPQVNSFAPQKDTKPKGFYP
jgi:hypothetical protein